MMRRIILEVKKNLYFPFAILSTLGVLIMCMLGELYVDDVGTSYTVLSVIVNANEIGICDKVELNWLQAWEAGIGNWFSLLIPLLVSLGFLVTTSTEKKKGVSKILIQKQGNYSYCTCKIGGVFFTGGTLLLVGYVLYGILLLPFFSMPYNFTNEVLQSYYGDSRMVSEFLCLYIIVKIVGIFLYGGMNASIGLCVSLFFSDKYILMCSPMLLKYIYSQILLKLEIDNITQNKKIVYMILEVLRLENIINISPNLSWFLSFCYMCIGYILCFCILYKKVNCRKEV